ncbi:MAG: hypothetical protein LBR32_10810 [Propionibacteriaceae bacterium]|nr:hypothetical protein [Propionibacteriaceae bacterium]
MLLQSNWHLFWFNVALYTFLVAVRRFVDVVVPQRWFDPARRWFRTRRWEHGGDFYRRAMAIDRWKDKLPTLEGRTHFDKKHLAGNQAEYLEQFIVETCRSESNHVRAITSVVVMRLWTPLSLWLLCLAVATVGNLPFICIQRYNRPRLQRALERVERRALANGQRYRPTRLIGEACPDALSAHAAH